MIYNDKWLKTRYYINPSIYIKKANKIIWIFFPIYKFKFILIGILPMKKKALKLSKHMTHKYTQKLLIKIQSLINQKISETLEIKY
uniref:Uncharacterized protein n=1 Tax=Methanosarcina barkeri (strain Fusaro / DSM 804) TaxID=269797 RepID=Q46FA7_METBF